MTWLNVKKYFWIIILTIFMSAALFLCFYINRNILTKDFPLRFKINGKETIECWEQDDENVYLFLPSYAGNEKVTVDISGDNKIIWGGVQLFSGRNIGDFEIDKEYELLINNQKPKKLTVLKSANVATMYIDTITSSMEAVHADKEHKENAKITLYTSEGKLNYKGDYVDQIRGRGNSTWGKEKKPYNLYLKKSCELLDMPLGEKWILLANWLDDTNLRNKIVYDFVRDHYQKYIFSPKNNFVDLFLNGEYVGLYLLCEDIENVVRQNFGDDFYDGILYQYEYSNRLNLKDPRSILDNKGRGIEIKYPENINSDVVTDLKKRIEMIYESVDREQLNDLIDIKSWIIKYLIEEIFLDTDGNGASQIFFYNRNQSKVYAGPCWDYDLTLGVVFSVKWWTPNTFWIKQTSIYECLFKDKNIIELILDFYKNDVSQNLHNLLNNLDPMIDFIKESSLLNSLRWGSVENLYNSVDSMKQFLKNRILFLDEIWINGNGFYTIKFNGVSMSPVCVLEGEKINIPTPDEVGLNGKTWYYEGTDEPFDYNTVITEDITLYAKSNKVIESNNNYKTIIKVMIVVAGILLVAGTFFAMLIIDMRRQKGMKK